MEQGVQTSKGGQKNRKGKKNIERSFLGGRRGPPQSVRQHKKERKEKKGAQERGGENKRKTGLRFERQKKKKGGHKGFKSFC